MLKTKPALIVIVGPTASGKSEFAVRIAKKYNGEIISADSLQIYKGLDIGTAKVPGAWRHGVFVYKKVPHYCIDFVSPKKEYSVAEFQIAAKKAIRDIARRGKLPILTGGTGLWVDTVVYGWRLPQVPPNQRIRRLLEKKTAAELLRMLQRIDPARAETIEQKNPGRLIRAIEIARALGSVPKLKKRSAYRALWIGLNPPPALLEKRIRLRAQKMVGGGLIPEIQKMRAKRIGRKRIQAFGFEYRAGLEYLSGTLNRETFIDRITQDTRLYARRQMTWFKRNRGIIWNPSPREIRKSVSEFLLYSFFAPPERHKK